VPALPQWAADPAYVKLLSRDLASDAESHVTGAADIVDGGLSSAP
jgi:hypothetical protein